MGSYQKQPGQRVPVLMYHRISELPTGSKVAPHYVSPKRFAIHLEVLRRWNWSSIAANRLFEAGRKSYALTFDDGYENFYLSARPLLVKFGLTATVFVVSGLVGKTNEWDECRGDVTEKLMGWDKLRDCQTTGIDVGSHTETHARLTNIAPKLVDNELMNSKETIEQQLGTECPLFCYPYGAMDDQVASAAQMAGYSAAFTTQKGAFHQGSAPFRIPRINVRHDTTALLLTYKILRAVYFDR